MYIIPNGCLDAYIVKVNMDIFKYQEKAKLISQFQRNFSFFNSSWEFASLPQNNCRDAGGGGWGAGGHVPRAIPSARAKPVGRYWGNTVVLGRMYWWMRSSFRRIGGQYLLRGEAPKKGIAPQFWGMMTAFTDTSDPELLYSHCWQVKTRIFNLVKNHVLGFLGGL